MPIHAEKNLYPGINAHLNSYLQQEAGGWESFHAEHVIDLTRVINENLPTGYFSRAEKSLQISEIAPDIAPKHPRTKPDVMIYKSSSPVGQAATATLTATPPAGTIAIIDTLTDEDYLTGIVIYQAGEGNPIGRPITRIELLSPANKPGGSHNGKYMVRRHETLQVGLRLVEIGYLHHTPPITFALASYPSRDKDAYPYTILVSDPRPTLEKGTTYIYGFGVNDSLPVVSVPLAGADSVLVDFGAAYNRTFESSRFFQMIVDYEQPPVQFDHYLPTDQEKINSMLAGIQESADRP